MNTTIRIRVEGMSCGSCARRVQQAVASVPGTGLAQVDLRAGLATVEIGTAAPEQVTTAITAAGYPAQVAQ